MTFAEYNTDENFDNDKSSLDELVKIGLSEGKTSDEIKSSLSPKWQKSKKIGEFDNYVTKYSKPKEEPKAEEKVVENVVEEEKPEEKKTEAPKAKTDTLTKTEKNYVTKQDELADNALNTVLNDVEDRSSYNWEQQYETGKKAGEAYNRIDDKLVAQLPTFLFKRFSNGEFGDPKSSDAKLRLAHFLLNGVQSKLKNASNAAMIAAGKAPMYQDTMSDYEKYQQTNFAKGMENRWRKYEAETQNAIDLVAKETGNEQGARLEAEKLTNDEKMGTRFKMMTAREKADLINIKMEIGKLVGKMDLSEIADFMTGEAINGDLSKDEAIAIGVAQLVKKTPELLKQLPEGKYKDMILGLFGGGDVDTIIASLGGNIAGGLPGGALGGNTEKSDYKDKAKSDIIALSNKYYNGEISEEDFYKQYENIQTEAKQNGINNILSIYNQTPKMIVDNMKAERQKSIKTEFKTLNQQAKNGEISPSKYKEQFDKLLETASKVGVDEKSIKGYEKNRVPTDTILKAAEKKAKKKK